MTPEALALFGPLLLFSGGVIGWFAKITLAALKSKPQVDPVKADQWNGQERRMQEVAKFEVLVHAQSCLAKAYLVELVDNVRREIKEDMGKIRDELRGELHSLHEEIIRSKP